MVASANVVLNAYELEVRFGRVWLSTPDNETVPADAEVIEPMPVDRVPTTGLAATPLKVTLPNGIVELDLIGLVAALLTLIFGRVSSRTHSVTRTPTPIPRKVMSPIDLVRTALLLIVPSVVNVRLGIVWSRAPDNETVPVDDEMTLPKLLIPLTMTGSEPVDVAVIAEIVCVRTPDWETVPAEDEVIGEIVTPTFALVPLIPSLLNVMLPIGFDNVQRTRFAVVDETVISPTKLGLALSALI